MKDNQSLAACDSAGWDSAPPQSQTNPLPRVLVVDDDMSIRQIQALALMRCGYKVDMAADGAAAWEALNTDSYDLMITDNNMPKVSGVELLKKLRAAHMALPVIMATGAIPKEEFTRSPWLQPAATLLKPYTFEEMLRTVKNVLREADGIADAPEQHPAHSVPRILAVDEDSDLRLLYADVLARPGYRVEAAEDGAAGWEALQANYYHLLITEHDLPKLTGVELVRKLRAARMALPVILAASRLPTEALDRHSSLQLAATLLKPFAVDALMDTVEKVLHPTGSAPEQITTPPNWQSRPSADAWRL